MQVNSKRGQSELTVLRDIVHLMASSADVEQSIRAILQTAQTMTGAAGSYFYSFDETVFQVAVEPEKTKDGMFYETLKTLALKLSAGVHVNPPLDAKMPYLGWVIAPVRVEDQTVAGLMLVFDSPFHVDEETQSMLAALVDTFAIVVGQARTHLQNRRAVQLTMSVLSSIADPLVVLDSYKRVLVLNLAAEALFQATTLEAAGKPMGEVIRSVDLITLAEQNKPLAEWEGGDHRTYVPRFLPVMDNQGQSNGWLLTLRDITQYKKLNRNQTEFTRIVSHDLRSPLTYMQGFASMLEMVGPLNEKQSGFVEKILAGITQMTGLVDNIQDAGRFDPETGFYEMVRAQCDVGEIVNKIVNNHLVPAEKQELSIAVKVADDVPIINADSNMLERAITNLVDNAIKYTPNGGKIEVGVQRRAGKVIISVKDSGLGISPEQQKQLFQRHVRLARQEFKKIKGSGLGLFIVRSVAQRHSGDAWVESIEGQGSTFSLSIPLEGQNLVIPGQVASVD